MLPEPFWTDGERTIYHGDCLEVLPTLPDSCASLIIADPPYFKVKREWWDRQWEKPEGFLSWLDSVLTELHRVLAPNGSLYLFASPRMAARVECLVAERFEVLNALVWSKAEVATHAAIYGEERFRQFVQKSERIIFAEHLGSNRKADGNCGDVFILLPVVNYLRSERNRVGIGNEEIDRLCGWRTTAFHFFATSASNFCLPTQEHYENLRRVFNSLSNKPGPFLARDYEDLRREYEDLRRPFNANSDQPYTDVWDFPTVSHYPGKHPCEKPLAMMEHIVSISSRPGDLVLDPFCGSGASGQAARNLGSRWVGIDAEEKWCKAASGRTKQKPNLFSEAIK